MHFIRAISFSPQRHSFKHSSVQGSLDYSRQQLPGTDNEECFSAVRKDFSEILKLGVLIAFVTLYRGVEHL